MPKSAQQLVKNIRSHEMSTRQFIANGQVLNTGAHLLGLGDIKDLLASVKLNARKSYNINGTTINTMEDVKNWIRAHRKQTLRKFSSEAKLVVIEVLARFCRRCVLTISKCKFLEKISNYYRLLDEDDNEEISYAEVIYGNEEYKGRLVMNNYASFLYLPFIILQYLFMI